MLSESAWLDNEKQQPRDLLCVSISSFVYLRFFRSIVSMCVSTSFPPFVEERHDNLISVKSKTWVLGAIYDTFPNDFVVVKL
jgi:hypothetical protein